MVLRRGALRLGVDDLRESTTLAHRSTDNRYTVRVRQLTIRTVSDFHDTLDTSRGTNRKSCCFEPGDVVDGPVSGPAGCGSVRRPSPAPQAAATVLARRVPRPLPAAPAPAAGRPRARARRSRVSLPADRIDARSGSRRPRRLPQKRRKSKPDLDGTPTASMVVDTRTQHAATAKELRSEPA